MVFNPEMPAELYRARTTQICVSRRSSRSASLVMSALMTTPLRSSLSCTLPTVPTLTLRQRMGVLPATMPSAVSKRTVMSGPLAA